MLLLLPEVLSAEELTVVRRHLAAAVWSDGRGSAGSQAVQVKHNEQLAAHSAELRALQPLIIGALERHPLLLSAALPKRVLPPQFNRYAGKRDRYGSHVDQAIRQFGPQGQERLRADLSCTLFLSDPDQYDGGELVIQDSGSERRVKLPAGHLVLYESTHVHRVEPVTRGERLASFFWIESLVRSAEQRQLLFEMDMALMRLREREGDSAETVSLVGSYHNLLRMWASP